MGTSAQTIRILSGLQVASLLDYTECVAAVDAAMRCVSAGQALLPLRQGMRLPDGHGALGMMPGFIAEPACFGIKLVSLFPGNTALGLSSHAGLYVLYEAAQGQPLAIIEAGRLTAMRTAAASVVATRALAGPRRRVLLVVGAGEQAQAHIEAFREVLPFERILVWARNSGAAARLAALFPDEACVESADSLPEACAEADVICTVTAAAEPVLAGAWLKAGTHLCLVGSSFPDRREVDDECVARGRYFVDYRGSAMAQAGELLHAIKSGRVSEAHVVAEIGAVLAGTVPGRRDLEEITIYKSLGVAAQDLAAGMALFRRAVLRDVGVIATL